MKEYVSKLVFASAKKIEDRSVSNEFCHVSSGERLAIQIDN